jgi:hypothetical protein
VYNPRINARVKRDGLVIYIKRALAGNEIVGVERNVYAAVRNYRAVRGGRLVPVAVYQTCRRRYLNNLRPIQFGHPEVARRRIGYVLGIGDLPIACTVLGIEQPSHITSRIRYRLGNLHEHANNPARPVHRKGIAHPALIELDVRPDRRPLLHATLVPPR